VSLPGNFKNMNSIWHSVADSDVRITAPERAMLNNIAGSAGICADILGNVVGEFRDQIAVAGTALGDEGTVPDMVRAHVINRTRWLWLCEFPQLKAFQTDGRKVLNDSAETALKQIASRELKVPPGDGSPADQTSSPSFGTRRGPQCSNPPARQFNRRNQDG
jgi:hypothetical protein